MYNAAKLIGLNLGRRGENLARTIEIDISSWLEEYPDATFIVYHKRHNDLHRGRLSAIMT